MEITQRIQQIILTHTRGGKGPKRIFIGEKNFQELWDWLVMQRKEFGAWGPISMESEMAHGLKHVVLYGVAICFSPDKEKEFTVEL